MRAKLKIKPFHAYGASVFLNKGGGITILQDDGDETKYIVFTLSEARLLAAALLEVVAAAHANGLPQNEEGTHAVR